MALASDELALAIRTQVAGISESIGAVRNMVNVMNESSVLEMTMSIISDMPDISAYQKIVQGLQQELQKAISDNFDTTAAVSSMRGLSSSIEEVLECIKKVNNSVSTAAQGDSMFTKVAREVLSLIALTSEMGLDFGTVAKNIATAAELARDVIISMSVAVKVVIESLAEGIAGGIAVIAKGLAAAVKAIAFGIAGGIVVIAKGIAVAIKAIAFGIAVGLKTVAGGIALAMKILTPAIAKAMVVVGILTGAIVLIVPQITNLVKATTMFVAELGNLTDAGPGLKEAAFGVAALGLAIVALLPATPAILAVSASFVGFGVSMTGASFAAGLLAVGLSRVVREMESIQRLRPAIAQGITVNRSVVREGEPPTNRNRRGGNTFALENGDDILRALLDIRDAVRVRREAERRI